MSVNAVSWAIDRAPVPGSRCVARMILVHLADKADADGRDTWKYVGDIADAIDVDDSTVHRNLAWLEEHGLIERGDQSLVSDYPVYARPVVWNLCVDRVREPSERAVRKGRPRSGRPRRTMRVSHPTVSTTRDDRRPELFTVDDGEPVSTVVDDGVDQGVDYEDIPALSSCDESVKNPVARVQPPRLHGCNHPGCTGAIHNVHKHPKTINPSTPTGYLPLPGETPTNNFEFEGDRLEAHAAPASVNSSSSSDWDDPADWATPTDWDDATAAASDADAQLTAQAAGASAARGGSDSTAPADAGSDATDAAAANGADAGVDGSSDGVDRVVDALRSRRQEAGLSASVASARDRRKVARLLEQLEAESVANPVAMVVLLVDWLVAHKFWAKRVRSGTDLARLFTEIRDDYLIDARTTTTGRTTTGARSASAAGSSSSTTAGSAVSKCVMNGHTRYCSHVASVVDSPECRRTEPSILHRHGVDSSMCDRVAGWLNAGVSVDTAITRLAKQLVDARQERELNRQRVRALCAARGGSMVIGSRPKERV